MQQTSSESSDQLFFTGEMPGQAKPPTSGNTNTTLGALGQQPLTSHHPHYGSAVCASICASPQRSCLTAGADHGAFRRVFTLRNRMEYMFMAGIYLGQMPCIVVRESPSCIWKASFVTFLLFPGLNHPVDPGYGGPGVVSSWQKWSQDVGSSLNRYQDIPCTRGLVPFFFFFFLIFIYLLGCAGS